jgi:hypothetical protein
MSIERGSSLETKRAMFRAALAAQCADEPYMTRNRIVAALLRAESVRALCSRVGIDFVHIANAIEDPQTLSFEACERRVMTELAQKGVEFGSAEHLAMVRLRPLDPAVRAVLDGVFFARHGHLAVSPLELLLDLIRADPALEARVAPHGLDEEVLRAALEAR